MHVFETTAQDEQCPVRKLQHVSYGFVG